MEGFDDSDDGDVLLTVLFLTGGSGVLSCAVLSLSGNGGHCPVRAFLFLTVVSLCLLSGNGGHCSVCALLFLTGRRL